MTETGSTVERLREQIAFTSKPSLRRALSNHYDPIISLEDAEALLAVVEAAEHAYFVNRCVFCEALHGMGHYPLCPMLALHSQASDEGKP